PEPSGASACPPSMSSNRRIVGPSAPKPSPHTTIASPSCTPPCTSLTANAPSPAAQPAVPVVSDPVVGSGGSGAVVEGLLSSLVAELVTASPVVLDDPLVELVELVASVAEPASDTVTGPAVVVRSPP